MSTYSEFKPEKIAAIVNSIKIERESLKNDLDAVHVYISGGNSKTGFIPSVSLIPVVDCGRNCAGCSKGCYDVRHDVIRPNVASTRAQNSALAHYARDRYFVEIAAYLTLNDPAAFRWHIGGDILDGDYFARMCKVAAGSPRTQHLAFTKSHDIVNAYLAAGHTIPNNLRIVFSSWQGLDVCNPHLFPVSFPKFPTKGKHATLANLAYNAAIPVNAFHCGGNCTQCFMRGVGCWNLRQGESVYFDAH